VQGESGSDILHIASWYVDPGACQVIDCEDILSSVWLNRLDFEGRLLGEVLELGRLIWDCPLVL